MNNKSQNMRGVMQVMRWGDAWQERISPPDTQYAQTGRRLYVMGDIDGQFRPRSNPYDLHAFGAPRPDDPLAEKLQGVWAQPVKGFSGYGYKVEINGETWVLSQAERFTQTFASAEFEYACSAAPLHALRRDFAAMDLPVLFSTLTLQNQGSQALTLNVTFNAHFDLQDAWFTHLGQRRNQGQIISVEAQRLVARAEALPEQWAAAVGGGDMAGGGAPALARVGEKDSGELACQIMLAPGDRKTLTYALCIEEKDGAGGALRTIDQALPRAAALLAEKQAIYEQFLSGGLRLVTPDASFNAAYDLARVNLQVLEAEQAVLGRYCYAGLEIFPFWFSNDGAYSIPGLMAAGMRETALNHLHIGLEHLEAGRVPHQISPSGRTAFSGNAQETPQWVISIWDAFRWSGDLGLLVDVFAGAWHGMFDYVLGTIDSDGDGYPSGPGMVEVEGMGAEKLDSAAYTWAALHALANMAAVLGKDAEAELARGRAAAIRERFDADWWDEAGGTYAMSLEDPGNAQKSLPHWAVIVPLEVDLASPEHAARTFTTLRAHYLNRWGLKHTMGSDERVWTLPTATLSRAAYRYGEPALGLRLLRSIAATLEHGSIGFFHELIPEGACIIQLWSGATFLRGVIEDLLGVEVRADLHQISMRPQLPPEWANVRLENLRFGEHRVSLEFTAQAVKVEHHSGPAELLVHAGARSQRIAAGENRAISTISE